MFSFFYCSRLVHGNCGIGFMSLSSYFFFIAVISSVGWRLAMNLRSVLLVLFCVYCKRMLFPSHMLKLALESLNCFSSIHRQNHTISHSRLLSLSIKLDDEISEEANWCENQMKTSNGFYLLWQYSCVGNKENQIMASIKEYLIGVCLFVMIMEILTVFKLCTINCIMLFSLRLTVDFSESD